MGGSISVKVKKKISTGECDLYYTKPKREFKKSSSDETPAILKPRYKLSPSLSEHEREIIESMGDAVYFKPRARFLGFTYNKEMPRWQALGFASTFEYYGFLQANKIDNEMYTGYDADILHMTDGGNDE
ncbi:hypothetical protein [Serratia rhizosphaerae]